MRLRLPSIREAKLLSQALSAQGLIILAFGPRKVAGASYGADRKKCRAMGKLLDAIQDRIESGELPVWKAEEEA